MSRDLWGADFSLGRVYFPGHLQGGRGFLEGAWGGCRAGTGQGHRQGPPGPPPTGGTLVCRCCLRPVLSQGAETPACLAELKATQG